MIYSTCTINRGENEEIAAYIENELGLQPDPLAPHLPAGIPGITGESADNRGITDGSANNRGITDGSANDPGIIDGPAINPGIADRSANKPDVKAEARENCLQLLPHIHGTDGFFIARFRK